MLIAMQSKAIPREQGDTPVQRAVVGSFTTLTIIVVVIAVMRPNPEIFKLHVEKKS